MSKKIYIRDQEKRELHDKAAKFIERAELKKGRSKEGYLHCPKCKRKFPVHASTVNGHPDYCSKKCKFGKGKKKRIREIEFKLTPEQRKTNRQLRRQEKLKKPFTRQVDFYSSEGWRALRYPILRKFNFMCLACGHGPRPGSPLHVDHIKPRSKYPELELDPDNLQVLCQDCNLSKSNHFEDDLRPKDGI